MTNTNAKMTKRDYFNRILSYAHDEDKAFIEHELELLDKRTTAERKPTPKQVENVGFKSDILAWMEVGETYTAADVVKGVPSIVAAGLSAQRVSAMLTQLVNDGSLVKTVDKRKSVYSLA